MTLPAAHLPISGPILRGNAWGQAYRLTEASPAFDGSPEATLEIVRWLGVERHPRWKPANGTTFCNVYAHDVCNAMGAYLPRVWWFPQTIKRIEAGQVVQPIYAGTVGELSANALCRWLLAHSAAFGWVRVTTLDEAQDAANRGHAVVICSRRTIEAASGHISCVVPESERCAAKRDAEGRVVLPVQSQAGGRNVEVGTLGVPWWRGGEMAEWGAWVHDPYGLRDTEPAPAEPPDTEPQTPTSKSSQSMRAVREPIVDVGTGANDWRPAFSTDALLDAIADDEPKGAA